MTRYGKSSARNARYGARQTTLALALTIATIATVAATPVAAQGWWPFGGNDEPPVPSEPVYRPDPAVRPPPVPFPVPPSMGGTPQYGSPQQGAPQQGGPPPAAAQNWSTKNPICLQLERRLVQESQKGDQWRSELPKLEAQINEIDRAYNVNSSRLDRKCYEYFLFTKSFRSTTACRELSRQVEGDKRRLAELEARKQALVSSGGRSYQNDIVNELARNNCGQNYVDQARRQGGGGIWSDDDSAFGGWSPQNAPTGAATYRTLCVRTCDGYYFPVSFATLPSHFETDANSCQSRCAAPAELYYYPNPGGTVNQSVAYTTQQPYTDQKFAFRYRKELVKGCSCKPDEYVGDQANAGAAARGALPGSATGIAPAAAPPATATDAPPAPVDDGWAPQ